MLPFKRNVGDINCPQCKQKSKVSVIPHLAHRMSEHVFECNNPSCQVVGQPLPLSHWKWFVTTNSPNEEHDDSTNFIIIPTDSDSETEGTIMKTIKKIVKPILRLANLK